jgi:hypothetical protein
MRSGSVVGSLWTPSSSDPVSGALPLFPVKTFNGQEMDGRTIDGGDLDDAG